jgi:hypothetical protein
MPIHPLHAHAIALGFTEKTKAVTANGQTMLIYERRPGELLGLYYYAKNTGGQTSGRASGAWSYQPAYFHQPEVHVGKLNLYRRIGLP